MSPLLLGAGIGVLLALANFCASLAVSSVAMRSFKAYSIGVIVGGFFIRLVVLSGVFYFLARVEMIDLPSMLVAFIVCFTILVFWEIRIYFRKARFSDEQQVSGIRAR